MKKKTKRKRKKKTKPRSRKRTGKKKAALKRRAGRKKIIRKRKYGVARKKTHKKRIVRKPPVQKPVLTLNTDFEFFYELRDLVLKSSPAEKDRMIERLNKLGRIKLAIISGVFINKENLDPLITDLLIIGDDVDRRKLRAFLRATEAEVGKEIKFTVMDKEEFQYRLAMFDRFTRVLLESPHEKLINRLGI